MKYLTNILITMTVAMLSFGEPIYPVNTNEHVGVTIGQLSIGFSIELPMPDTNSVYCLWESVNLTKGDKAWRIVRGYNEMHSNEPYTNRYWQFGDMKKAVFYKLTSHPYVEETIEIVWDNNPSSTNISSGIFSVPPPPTSTHSIVPIGPPDITNTNTPPPGDPTPVSP